MKKTRSILLFLACMVSAVQAQVYNEMDVDGNITQRNEYGSHSNFNPNKRDSVKGEKEIPIGVRLWKVDRRFGDIIPTEIDTLTHLFQNTIYNTGIYGEYNSTGSNYTPRLNRIFTDRPTLSEFYFTQPFSFTNIEPDQFLFVNTLSPYTRINYDECGDKQSGEDHIDAKFAVNVDKRLGFGFDLDYFYSLGYFDNQNNSNFRSSLFASYLGDKYQMSILGSLYHRKTTENGGIIDDKYITHPESLDETFSENEIPTVLSHNWQRNNSQHLFLSHRYNIGFYRLIPMTEEEIKAKKFAQESARQKQEQEEKASGNSKKRSGRADSSAQDKPKGRPDNAAIVGMEPSRDKPTIASDTTRIKVDSQAKLDSLNAAQALQDSIDATMKKEFVPVTSFIHTLDINNHDRIYQAYETPAGYYAKTYYELCDDETYAADSIYDKTKFLSIKNTVALALLEGFNKYMKAGMKVFASYDFRKYQMPDLTGDSTTYFMNKWTEYDMSIGGQISKTQGKTLHFNLAAEYGLLGYAFGDMAIDFSTDVNIPLFGDTLQVAAKARFSRATPTYMLNHYHSKHLWWDQSLDKETRTRIEGMFSYPKTNTRLRVAVDQLKNYTYFGMSYSLDENNNRKAMTGGVYQESSGINILTAQLYQNFRLGIINWENVVTWQNSSNNEVLPLPKLNLFSNLFLKFKIARVLSVELGGCVTYFTKYEAPDYLPTLGQFAIQQNADNRVELGQYPFVDVYVNMQLKRARFFLTMNHINAGSGNKMSFLTPHYPSNSRILRFGISWNFYN